MNVETRSSREFFFAGQMTLRQILTSRRIRLIVAGGVVIVCLVFAFGAVPPSVEEQTDLLPTAAEPIPVAVTTITAVDSFSVRRVYTGVIEARRNSALSFVRSARVVEVRVDEGQSVEQEQILGRQDIRQIENQRQRTMAQRDEAAALLAELEAGPRLQSIEAARADVADLTAQHNLGAKRYRRSSELLSRGAISDQQFDESALELESAAARVAAARERLDELESGTRTERVDAQQAVVAQLDAALATLAIDIEDSTLVAPFSGRIGRRLVDEGVIVASGQPILELIESADLQARIGLTVEAFSQLVVGEASEIRVGRHVLTGTFERALPEIELQTRTRAAIFGLEPAAAEYVVPGEVARLSVDEVQTVDGFQVPTTALIRSARGLWSVYAVEFASADLSGQVARREVELLHTDGDRTFVRGTLLDGDRIIASGTHRVVPGQLVVISREHSRDAAAMTDTETAD